MFGNYSKLWGSLIGSAVGMLVTWAAVNMPAITTCTDMASAASCTTLGLGTAELTALVVTGSATLFTWLFPKNAPS